jgi:predicted AAA+ superfamily ATPase
MDDLFERAALGPLRDLMARSPGVLVHGPRGCGKRTLTDVATRDTGHEVVSLDDPVTLALALEDPAGFAWELPDRVVIEEVHRVPGLLSALAAELARDPVGGRLIAISCVGQMEYPLIAAFRLDPMSQSEFGDWNSVFTGRLFNGAFDEGDLDRLGFELDERVVDGGYPEAIFEETAAARARWYAAHVVRVIDDDIAAGSRLRNPRELGDVLSAVAARTGDLLNVSDISEASGPSRPTVEDYLARLARAHLVDVLPAWRAPSSMRLVVTPRIHVNDTGIGAALLNVTAEDLASDRALRARLLSTFVFQELRRQVRGLAEACTFSHLRDRDGANVDVVLERGDGRVAGVCIRPGGTVRSQDFRGLRKLRGAAADRFGCGVVLYEGESAVAFDEKLFALPIRMLWETP